MTSVSKQRHTDPVVSVVVMGSIVIKGVMPGYMPFLMTNL